MKILHISASYKPAYIYGGPTMSIAKLCEVLAEREEQRTESGKLKAESSKLKLESKKCRVASEKFNLEVFTTTANGRNELDVEDRKPILVDGVPVTYFKRWTKDHSHFSPGLLWRLRKVLRQAQHDNLIVHIHAWWNLVSVLSCLVAKWYNVPVVLSPRGMLNEHSKKHKNGFAKNLLHILFGKKLLKYCHLHLTSEKEKRELFGFLDSQKMTVIPNLINFESLMSKAEYTNYKPLCHFKFIVLARVEKIKGLELLFDALSLIEIDFQLTIAGSGEDSYVESLKRKAESLKLGEHIEWVGQVGYGEKFSIMAKHDLMVLPSYNENFANVVLESLSVGTPVLVSEKVGLADYVKANDLGWICSLEPKNIAEKITEACASIEKREKISRTAPTIIKRDFNDEVLVERYLELYGDVLQLGSNTKNSQLKIS